MNNKAVILFDGVCNLCESSVLFVIKRDTHSYFNFTSLDSPISKRLLMDRGIDPNEIDSIVLIENSKFYTESSAALRIAKRLNGLWPLLYIFIIVPKFIRNSVYKFIAKNRYKWFGKKDSCMVPTKELKERFL